MSRLSSEAHEVLEALRRLADSDGVVGHDYVRAAYLATTLRLDVVTRALRELLAVGLVVKTGRGLSVSTKE
jgi:hypothetical protein